MNLGSVMGNLGYYSGLTCLQEQVKLVSSKRGLGGWFGSHTENVPGRFWLEYKQYYKEIYFSISLALLPSVLVLFSESQALYD